MFNIFQILTAILVAVAWAMALAHALELPGKMRLTRETYFAMQPIYYPGFVIGGAIGEFGGLIATLILLLFTPLESAKFWLTLVALLGLVGKANNATNVVTVSAAAPPSFVTIATEDTCPKSSNRLQRWRSTAVALGIQLGYSRLAVLL